MRSTKKIRRNLWLYVSLAVMTAGLTIYFAVGCFLYLTIENAGATLFFLALTALSVGGVVVCHHEHKEALNALYPTRGSTDLQDR